MRLCDPKRDAYYILVGLLRLLLVIWAWILDTCSSKASNNG